MRHSNVEIATITTITFLLALWAQEAAGQIRTTISTSAPLMTDSSAMTSQAALKSVFRVICNETTSYGTGFLHKSGNVITAAHVVDGCNHPVVAMLDNTTVIPADVLKIDSERDLALLKPRKKIESETLSISNAPTLQLGSEISFWGFPAGYTGISPMLSVGYLSGVDGVPTKSHKLIAQLVVNAAINHGNSGGPVVLVETGEVIGVADNKIAPLSSTALSALAALQVQGSGIIYTAKKADGSQQTFSEGQIVAMVLEELRQQVQLVIGHAVMLGDLRAFLKESGVEP